MSWKLELHKRQDSEAFGNDSYILMCEDAPYMGDEGNSRVMIGNGETVMRLDGQPVEANEQRLVCPGHLGGDFTLKWIPLEEPEPNKPPRVTFGDIARGNGFGEKPEPEQKPDELDESIDELRGMLMAEATGPPPVQAEGPEVTIPLLPETEQERPADFEEYEDRIFPEYPHLEEISGSKPPGYNIVLSEGNRGSDGRGRPLIIVIDRDGFLRTNTGELVGPTGFDSRSCFRVINDDLDIRVVPTPEGQPSFNLRHEEKGPRDPTESESCWAPGEFEEIHTRPSSAAEGRRRKMGTRIERVKRLSQRHPLWTLTLLVTICVAAALLIAWMLPDGRPTDTTYTQAQLDNAREQAIKDARVDYVPRGRIDKIRDEYDGYISPDDNEAENENIRLVASRMTQANLERALVAVLPGVLPEQLAEAFATEEGKKAFSDGITAGMKNKGLCPDQRRDAMTGWMTGNSEGDKSFQQAWINLEMRGFLASIKNKKVQELLAGLIAVGIKVQIPDISEAVANQCPALEVFGPNLKKWFRTCEPWTKHRSEIWGGTYIKTDCTGRQAVKMVFPEMDPDTNGWDAVYANPIAQAMVLDIWTTGEISEGTLCHLLKADEFEPKPSKAEQRAAKRAERERRKAERRAEREATKTEKKAD